MASRALIVSWGLGFRVESRHQHMKTSLSLCAAAGTQLLGGSRVVISGVISRVTTVIAHIRGLITPLITTHEPPSSALASCWEAQD